MTGLKDLGKYQQHSSNNSVQGCPELAHLAQKLREKGSGSLLRGWRLELDPDSHLVCGYQEFCRAAEKVGYHEDIAPLFAKDGDNSTLNFSDVGPEEYRVICTFKEWIKKKFGGPSEWLEVFDPRAHGLSQEDFLRLCKQQGFPTWNGNSLSDATIRELFQGIDLNACGHIQFSEVPFLELDEHVRELELYQLRSLKMEEERSKLTSMLEEGRELAKKLSPAHRLALRPWQEHRYAKMPTVVKQKRAETLANAKKKIREARELFTHHLQSTYGNEVRAWRRGLDPQCAFTLNETDLRCYCRNIDFTGDAHALWTALDRDGDGVLEFEELCLMPADALARFRSWVRNRYFLCANLWDQSALEHRREKSKNSKKWVSTKKMLLHDLRKALEELGFPEAKSKEHMRLLLSSLDLYGCGFVSLADFEWLDSWHPAEWLNASPDEKSWLELRQLFLRKCDHLLHAWRSILDVDGSNRVSWREFKAASEKVNFKGNIGSAWRWLDDDLSGWISLQEVDPASSEMLHSFKSWADTTFGSVRLAFQALDSDGGGTLSFSELRRACRKWRWDGEVRTLFNCLDIDQDGHGRRQISIHEIGFLDDWEELGPSGGENSPASSGKAPAAKVKQPPLATTQHAASQPELPSLLAATGGLQKNSKKVHPGRSAVKQLCQTFKCPQLIKSKPPCKETVTWLDRLWLASRENRDTAKGGVPVRASLSHVTLPDFKVIESAKAEEDARIVAKAAEDARMTTEALKEKVRSSGLTPKNSLNDKVRSSGLTLFSAAQEEECITGGYLALPAPRDAPRPKVISRGPQNATLLVQFDLGHHPEHHFQRTMKLESDPLAGLPAIR